LQRVRAAAVVAALADGKSVPVSKPGGMTFADAGELYIEKCLDGKRTRVEIKQLIRGKLFPAIGRLPLTSIRHEDLVILLREIADRPERRASGRIISGGPHCCP
jgi:hypothetical protein